MAELVLDKDKRTAVVLVITWVSGVSRIPTTRDFAESQQRNLEQDKPQGLVSVRIEDQ